MKIGFVSLNDFMLLTNFYVVNGFIKWIFI